MWLSVAPARGSGGSSDSPQPTADLELLSLVRQQWGRGEKKAKNKRKKGGDEKNKTNPIVFMSPVHSPMHAAVHRGTWLPHLHHPLPSHGYFHLNT